MFPMTSFTHLMPPMNLYIPVFKQNLAGICFSSETQNPGIGGTEFTSIKLAILLAERYTDINVFIANHYDLNLETNASNLSVGRYEGLDHFLEAMAKGDDRSYLALMTQGLLNDANPILLKRISKRIIGWLHFPYMYDKLIKELNLPAIVHVGSEQYWSNKPFYKTNWYIQNPFLMPSYPVCRQYAPNNETLDIVHLGALFKSKGFYLIARQWPALKALYPNVRLHVIGSSSTYGGRPENEHIPCYSEYANELLSFISLSDIESKRVVFYGNLGEEKFHIIRNCHVALLNPNGATEAFPASVLECMACGVPVIASDDFGMADAMRFFPQLALDNPKQIPGKLEWLLQQRLRHAQMSERSIYVAKWFDSQTDIILSRWRQLFLYINSTTHQGRIPNNPPLDSHHTTHRKLYQYQLRAFLRCYIATPKSAKATAIQLATALKNRITGN